MTEEKLINLARVGMGIHSPNDPEYIVCEALIKALTQRTWVGLTDDERTEIRSKVQVYTAMDNIQYGLAIQHATETKLKEKNT